MVPSRRRVPVEWVYAKKPVDTRPTVLNRVGQPLLVGSHVFWPERHPVRRIWCQLCQRYFGGWKEVIAYHKVAQTKRVK